MRIEEFEIKQRENISFLIDCSKLSLLSIYSVEYTNAITTLEGNNNKLTN